MQIKFLWLKTFFTVFILVLIDQILKNAALAFLSQGPVNLSDYFGFEIHKNSGIAFGIPIANGVFYFAVFVFLFLLSIGRFLDFQNLSRHQPVGLVFLLAGAAGNMIDRLRWGYIIDLISVKGIFVFNLADVFIVIGAVMLLRDFLDPEKRRMGKASK